MREDSVSTNASALGSIYPRGRQTRLSFRPWLRFFSIVGIKPTIAPESKQRFLCVHSCLYFQGQSRPISLFPKFCIIATRLANFFSFSFFTARSATPTTIAHHSSSIMVSTSGYLLRRRKYFEIWSGTFSALGRITTFVSPFPSPRTSFTSLRGLFARHHLCETRSASQLVN